jgi:hypothetical protein
MPKYCVVCEVKFMSLNPHKYFAKYGIMTVVQSFILTVNNRLLNTHKNVFRLSIKFFVQLNVVGDETTEAKFQSS